MAENYLPTREAELVNWLNNFDSVLAVDPAGVGVSPAQSTTFATLKTSFTTAWATATAPETNSTANTIAKNLAKEAVIDGPGGVRQLVRIIQAFPATTDFQRGQLGISLRDSEPTPIPVPRAAPTLIVEGCNGRTFSIRLQDSDEPTNRGKPEGVKGAAVFSYVGDEAPADISSWTFHGNTSKVSRDITMPATVANGSEVWFTAYWFNPALESGPATPPVSAIMQGGGVTLNMAA